MPVGGEEEKKSTFIWTDFGTGAATSVFIGIGSRGLSGDGGCGGRGGNFVDSMLGLPKLSMLQLANS